MRQHLNWLGPLVVAVMIVAAIPHSLAQSARAGLGKRIVIEIENGFVSPSTVAVKPGTTVVWRNLLDQPADLNLQFNPQTQKPCRGSDGSEGSFRDVPTSSIPPFGEVSLCFATPGTYSYAAAPQGPLVLGAQPAFGTLIVKKN